MFNNKIQRDMQLKKITKQRLPFFVALGLMAMLTSCGSFQYAGYDNDGIYTTTDTDVIVEEPEVVTSTNSSSYYKNYFAEKVSEIDAINSENEVFTDIDSYEGNYTETDTDRLEQPSAYGGWGQTNDRITINVIDNGWGWNDPWLWNGGFVYNNWGWGRPWGWNNWGRNYWGWNTGFGYGWNNWGWNSWNNGWNNGWNNWGWNNGFYRNNRYAYSNSRRGSLLNSNSLNRSNSALSRNYSSRRSSTSSAISRRGSTGVRSVNSSTRRTVRNGASTRTTRPTTTRNTRTRVSTPRSTRSSGSVRSSSRSSSSRSSSVRSSSSSRSSSGSSRSSGSRSSGSRSSSSRSRQ